MYACYSGGGRPLRLKTQLKSHIILERIKRFHIRSVFERISANLDLVLSGLDDEAVSTLKSKLDEIPGTRDEFMGFMETLVEDKEYVPRLLGLLEEFARDNIILSKIRYDWNLIVKLSTEDYISASKNDLETIKPLLKTYQRAVKRALDEGSEVMVDGMSEANGMDAHPEDNDHHNEHNPSSLRDAHADAFHSGHPSDHPLGEAPVSLEERYRVRLQNFVKIHQVGQGAYGDVWLAEDIVNKIPVALKKLKLSENREGFPKNAIREILLLNTLKHRNVVNLLGIAYSTNVKRAKGSSENTPNRMEGPDAPRPHSKKVQEVHNVWMVFEYLPLDLSGYIEALKDKKHQTSILSLPEIKSIMYQIFQALAFIHKHSIVHRDLKTANILMNLDGQVKLADFGLARQMPYLQSGLTNRVVTLWYRSPELLLGDVQYGYSVDMWSAGCILCELVSGSHLFAADKENAILRLIAEHLGVPNEAAMRYFRTLPLYSDVHSNPLHPDKIGGIPSRYSDFESTFRTKLGTFGYDLLRKLLDYNPGTRITAEAALGHPFFKDATMCMVDRNIKVAHSFMKRKQGGHGARKKDYVKYANIGNIREIKRKQAMMSRSNE